MIIIYIHRNKALLCVRVRSDDRGDPEVRFKKQFLHKYI
jgi:hypothetical protein